MKCAWKECENEFEKKTFNNIYCSDYCKIKATNANRMREYYERRARTSGKNRVKCKGDCGTTLSIYNDTDYCASCTSKNKRQRGDQFRRKWNGNANT